MFVRLTFLSTIALLAACDEGVLETPASTNDVMVQDNASDETAPNSDEDAFVEPMVIDLGATSDDSWYAVNDTVMGGVSEGIVDYSSEALIFEGAISTANNGGFASVRSPSASMDLRDFERVVMRIKNEGQPFTFVLADSNQWWDGQFRYDIELEDAGWNEIAIDLRDFEFYDFSTGYPIATGETMKKRDRKNILFVEFMSALFEEGDFLLEVDHITFE